MRDFEQVVGVPIEYNLKRHFEFKHSDFNQTYSRELENQKK
jgi:hypothetical protein